MKDTLNDIVIDKDQFMSNQYDEKEEVKVRAHELQNLIQENNLLYVEIHALRKKVAQQEKDLKIQSDIISTLQMGSFGLVA